MGKCNPAKQKTYSRYRDERLSHGVAFLMRTNHVIIRKKAQEQDAITNKEIINMSINYAITMPGTADVFNKTMIYTSNDSCIIVSPRRGDIPKELVLSDAHKRAINALPLSLADLDYIESDKEMADSSGVSDLVELPFEYTSGGVIKVRHEELFPIICAYDEQLLQRGKELAEKDIDEASESYANCYFHYTDDDQERAMTPDQYYDIAQDWLPQVIVEQLTKRVPEAFLPVWYKLRGMDDDALRYQKTGHEGEPCDDDMPF